MQNDVFLEQTVARLKRAPYIALYLFLWFLVLFFGFYAAISLFSILTFTEAGQLEINFVAAIILVVCAAIAFFIYRRTDDVLVEYDYAFTNGIIDVSRVMNRRRRKYMMELNLNDVISCGPVTDPSFARAQQEPDVKKYDFSLNKDARRIYFYFQKNSIKYCVVLEPSVSIEKAIRSRQYLPRDAWREVEQNG